jgi:hypothetical protein
MLLKLRVFMFEWCNSQYVWRIYTSFLLSDNTLIYTRRHQEERQKPARNQKEKNVGRHKR